MAHKDNPEEEADVVLKWQDFVHYLEEAKYLDGDFSEERDWYKLNPFEILHLGCKCIIENGIVSQKIGSITVGIESISPYLYRAPRFFRSILDVLMATLNSNKSSVFTWKRCWSVIFSMKSATAHNLRLYLQLVKVLLEQKEAIESVCQNQPSSIRCQVKDVFKELKLMQTVGKNTLSSHCIEDQVDGAVSLQIHLITERYGMAKVDMLWQELGVEELIKNTSEYASSKESLIAEILMLLEIFLKILEDKESLGEGLAIDSNGSILEGMKKVIGRCKGVVISCCDIFKIQSSAPANIFAYINAVLYSTYSNARSLKETWTNACIVDTLESLARFSSNENESEMAVNIFEHALEFMTTSTELGIPQFKASLVILPNLLSPVLGCKDGRLTCKALEYGALALRSKHQKSLLAEGIWYINKCKELFRPIEEIREHTTRCENRIEAVLSSVSILDELLQKIDSQSSGCTEKAEIEGLHQELRGSEPVPITKAEEEKSFETEVSAEDRERNEGTSWENNEQEKTQLQPHLNNEEERMMEKQASCAIQKQMDVDDYCSTKELPPDEWQDSSHDAAIIKHIHLLLYDLACSIIKAGSNTGYTFAGVIPSLFSPSYLPDLPIIPMLPPHFFREFQTGRTTISWKVDKKELAVKALELSVKFMNHGTSSAFQICSVMIPKLARNLNKNRLTDTEKMKALIDFINLCISKAHENNAVNGLITHGLDLISMLMPTDLDISEMKVFLPMMLKSLDKILNSTSLLFLRSSCDFFMITFPDATDRIKDLFFKLLQRGKKNDIRNVHQLSAPWLADPRFHFVLDSLFKYAAGKLKSKQIENLSEILSTIVDIEKRLASKIKEHISSEEHKEYFVKQLTSPIIDDVTESIKQNAFDHKMQGILLERVSNLTLYKAFFEEELMERALAKNGGELIVDEMIPEDVKQDGGMMRLLQSIARRIEHMQLPRYQSLKKLLVEIVKQYIKYEKEPENNETGQEKNIQEAVCHEKRAQNVENYLKTLPQNRCLYDRLLRCGYKQNLWDDEIKFTVTTDGSLYIEENLRQTLLASFNEYVELLKQLGIPSVKIEGKPVKIHEIFSDDLTINDLKGRRAIVVKAVDKELSNGHHPRIQARKLQILSDEERIENDMEAKSKGKLKPKTFTVKINIKFFDCASCCGSQIIGCYAPNGDHCERPLEIGLRYDSAFASIYDDSGLEIENAELLFMDQGVLVFRAYSNGHPYDTSQVWNDLFEELVEKRDVIPAIIVPYHLPNRHTWESIRRIVPTLLTGAMLTCEFDFSTEWNTYYDGRPEFARCGKEIIISKGFRCSKRPGLLKQFSTNAGKDLGGMVFDDVMQNMMKDEKLNRFRFLGGAIAEYICEFIESGEENENIIHNVFNYDRWIEKNSKTGNAELMTKDEITNAICTLVRNVHQELLSKLDLKDMFKTKRRQFFQLKRFQEKVDVLSKSKISGGLNEKITSILKLNLQITAIDELQPNVQEEVMHWIFGNEDRVWRYRGGRDGYETIEQYLNFLGHIRNSKEASPRLPAFPGVLAVLKSDNHLPSSNIQVKNIAGYAVGEYVENLDAENTDQPEKLTENPDFYEIVTAWVHPDYRKVSLSNQLYLKIFQSVKSKFVAFEVLQGSVQRILKSSPVLRTLATILPLSMLVQTQERSYEVSTSVAEEQFERLIIRKRPVKYATLFSECATSLFRNRYFAFLPVMFCSFAVVCYFVF